MAKQSRKRLLRSERDSTGCLWGIINMFDFRQPQSPTKLLLDRKCGTSRHFGANYSKDKDSSLSSFEVAEEVTDADEIREENINLVKKSVRTLVEEEMSEVQPATKIPCEEIEQIPPEKKYEDAIQTYKGVSDLFNNLKSNGMDPTERSSQNFDLATFMINLYGDNHQYRGNHVEYEGIDNTCNVSKTSDHGYSDELDFELAEKQVMLHKSLVDVADVFLRQKFTDSKPLSGEVQPREFMDALEILNTNKELLLSLLQDPDSLLLKLVQDHKKAQLVELAQSKGIGSSAQHEEFLAPKEPNNQSGYKFFRKKDKSKLEKSLEGSDSSCVDKIVILKPRLATVQNSLIPVSPRSSPRSHDSLVYQEDGERVASHFSLKSFKRRLQKVIGGSRKQRHVISMEGVLHRIPYGLTESGSPRKDNVLHACSRNGDEKDKPNDNFLISGNDRRMNMAATAPHLNSESFDKEAKKHLAQFLDTRDNDDCSQVRRASKTLGILLSLPEYEISPTLSPRRDKELDIFPTKENDTSNHLSSPIQDLKETSCSRGNPDDNAGPIDVQPELIDTDIKEGTYMVEDLNQTGTTEIVPEAEIISKEECDRIDTNSESDGDVTEGTSEKHIEDKSTAYSGRVSAQESAPANPRLSKPCSSLLKQMFKDPESILGVSEQPSPISVLEPLFSEDFNNSGCELDQSPVRHLSIHLQEPATPDEPRTSSASEANPQTCITDNGGIVRFVKVVLELAGLNRNDILHRWDSPDQLLDPSLCDQVGISDSELSDDPKLLFDCTSEALEQIQDSWSPWASLVKKNVRPIPMGENLIQEVCKVIERNRQWQSPRTLDQIVKKDLDGQNWLVVWSDTESITVEIENAILEELIEETVHEMWV